MGRKNAGSAPFTPGPWRISRPLNGSYFIEAGIPGVTERTIVIVSDEDVDSETDGEVTTITRRKIKDAAANAALIAAAPDLYEALYRLVPTARAALACMDEEDVADLERAIAALAKAEGRQP